MNLSPRRLYTWLTSQLIYKREGNIFGETWPFHGSDCKFERQRPPYISHHLGYRSVFSVPLIRDDFAIIVQFKYVLSRAGFLILGFKSPAMLPPPTLSFTIPSVHDGLDLQCRVYHPTCLLPTEPSHVTGWRKRAAIVAHPYAPLGGCYDDPVVDRIASTILKEGFLVGTFNFRCVFCGR